MKTNDFIVIGGGPAGLTAGLYCKRNGYTGLIIIDEIGGQVGHSSHIENYPGFPQITGMNLINNMLSSVEDICEYAKVIKVQKNADIFEVYTDSQNEPYYTKTIIFATGCTPRTLLLPDEEKLISKGVHYCATCDGPLYKGKVVAVIGDGNAALEYARTLVEQGCEKVFLLALTDKLFGEVSVIEKVLNNDKIIVLFNSTAKEYYIENNQLTGLIFEHKNADAPLLLQPIAGVFIAIGQKPNTQLAAELNLDLDEQGYIIAPRGSTSCPGVFAAGDCVSGNTHQIVSAAASGVEAAMRVQEFLRK